MMNQNMTLHIKVQIKPQAYAFEPIRRPQPYDNVHSASDSDDDRPNDNANQAMELDLIENRLDNTNWCLCGNCTVMPTQTESLCCQEADMQDKLEDLSVTHYCHA